jgi:23S rRNA (pseudouridine1915-N3)-methyltransferase
MKIKIYFFGKKNEITSWEKEYLRRINFRCKCELISLNQARIKDPQTAKEKESKTFLNKISIQQFVIAFDEHGKSLDSIKFSQWTKKQLETFGEIIFVIGGAHGLSQKVLERANTKISFGSMVWTRNLVRLMACEQIYRALEIDGGGHFHKN